MTVLVVDLSSIAVRHYHAHGKHGGHSTSDRTVADVRELVVAHGLDGVAICCDCPNVRTWRHELYPKYKADRPPWELLLVQEYERTKRVLAESWPVFAVPGFEGEDLAATVIAQLWGQPVSFVVASSDKDVLQMVCRRLRVLRLGKAKRMMDSGAVLAAHRVEARQIRDWLCLMGDSCDGIPGVRGIGEKRAAELLKQHQTLEEVLRAAMRDPHDRIMRAINAGVAELEVARRLVTLRKDAPVDCSQVLRRRVA